MGVEPTVGAFGQVTATTVMMLPIALLTDAPWRLALPGPAVAAALAGLALLSTALAYIIFFRLLATAGATNTSLVTLLVPVSAVLLGIAFLGERLSTSQAIGMGLIGLGLVAIDGRAWARWRQPRGDTSAHTEATQRAGRQTEPARSFRRNQP